MHIKGVSQFSYFEIPMSYMERLSSVYLQTQEERLRCAICEYLLNGPLQFPCGHRLCMSCARKLKQKNAQTFFCKKCKGMTDFMDYFHDKAVAREIDYLIVSCPYDKCNWTGEYRHFQNHVKDECQMVEVQCPNKGCMTSVVKRNLDKHLEQCEYRMIKCQWCKEDIHYYQVKEHKTICAYIPVECPNKCRDSVPRKQINLHLDPHNQLACSLNKANTASQECLFSILGCRFVVTASELEKHLEENVKYHLYLVGKYLSEGNANGVNKVNNEAMKKLLYSELHKVNEALEAIKDKGTTQVTQLTELHSKQNDISFRLTGVEDTLGVVQENITEINRTYEDVSLTLQTLQATSYDGKYIWKIPDITRRRRDAQMGKTISLYSAPFYTDRFGYKMCLRVYLDGDGSGKGHYISYFLTIMRGEYDALLEWPFHFMVTMTMINQKGGNNIVQSFKPNPNSASFHQPTSDMNVASGCPKFAALSVLDNSEFIVDDTAFFQCKITLK